MLSHVAYLSSPYSHSDPDVRQQRFAAVCRAAARMMVEDRVAVYSPVAHGHSVAEQGGINAMNHQFWMSQCLPFVGMVDELVVLKLDGWEDSQGIKSEIAQAEMFGVPVRYVDA